MRVAVGIQEELEVLSELIVAVVIVAFDGRVFEGPVHPLDLPVGPGMVRLRQAILDAMLFADAIEHLPAVAAVGPDRLRGAWQNCWPLSVSTVWIS